jgi:hypothetical protein
MRSKSVKEWLGIMKGHACENKKLTSDDEYDRLAVNYTCSCGERFPISLVAIKETVDELEAKKKAIFLDLIKTHAGREALVKTLV